MDVRRIRIASRAATMLALAIFGVAAYKTAILPEKADWIALFIGVCVAGLAYAVSFHLLALMMVPGIDSFIVEDDHKTEGSTHTHTTRYRRTGDAKFDAYLDDYIRARQASMMGMGAAVVLVVVVACAMLIS